MVHDFYTFGSRAERVTTKLIHMILCIVCSFLHLRAVSSSNTMDKYQSGLLPVVTDHDVVPKSVASKTTNIWLATTDCRDVKLYLSARYFG